MNRRGKLVEPNGRVKAKREAVVTCSAAAREDEARCLAAHLRFPFARETAGTSGGFTLDFDDHGLCLRMFGGGASSARAGEGQAFRVDFLGGAFGYRRKRGGGARQPLARAVGIRGGKRPRVLDATAGLGRDAFVLAALGCRVTLIERHPVIAALLRDGLERAAADPATAGIAERMALIVADAADMLAAPTGADAPDVVYLDPMYPHRSGSALVKKEMRLLREVVGDDEDASELLRAALKYGTVRVVVKRPKGAPRLGDAEPDGCVESANTRYDIYGVR